jgi:hypothetical protein
MPTQLPRAFVVDRFTTRPLASTGLWAASCAVMVMACASQATPVPACEIAK